MSHFSVLVIADKPLCEKTLTPILQPWHEYECTGTEDQYVIDLDVDDRVREEFSEYTYTRWKDENGELHSPYDDRFYRELTAAEEAESMFPRGTGGGGGKSWTSKDWGDGRGYRTKMHLKPDEVGMTAIEVPASSVETIEEWAEGYGGWKPGPNGRFIDRTNPNKKWDWWQVGGRYSGKFAPHYDPEKDPANRERCWLCVGTGKREGCPPELGCNGCRGTGIMTKWPTQWKTVGNVAQVKDIPLEALRNIAEHKALAEYDRARAIIAGRPIPDWNEMRERLGIEAAREQFREDPIVKGLEAGGFDRWDMTDLLDGFRLTRAEVATRARQRAVQTFAVVKDGNWYERGSMGWFGCVSDEKDKDTWDREFAALVDSLPQEAWLAVVDCHI